MWPLKAASSSCNLKRVVRSAALKWRQKLDGFSKIGVIGVSNVVIGSSYVYKCRLLPRQNCHLFVCFQTHSGFVRHFLTSFFPGSPSVPHFPLRRDDRTSRASHDRSCVFRVGLGIRRILQATGWGAAFRIPPSPTRLNMSPGCLSTEFRAAFLPAGKYLTIPPPISCP